MLKDSAVMTAPSAASEPLVAGHGTEQRAVTIAAAGDVPRLACALADAFANDPVYRWMLPASVRLRARLRVMFTAEMEQYGMPQGDAWTNGGRDGAVVALPPGAWEMPKSLTLTQALMWARAFGRRLPRAASVQRAMEERHIREPHFYVRLIGVRPSLQGRGLGSALMQPTLQRADSAGVATYIEASTRRSAALYERLGFQHTGVLELPDGGPPLWLMRRPAAGSAHQTPGG